MWQGEYCISSQLDASALIQNYNYSGGASLPFTGMSAEKNNVARKSYDNTLFLLRFDQRFALAKVIYQAYIRNEWNGYSDAHTGENSLHFNREQGV